MANNSAQNICRLCGLSGGYMTSILDPKHGIYMKRIAELLHINIDAHDLMPKVLCHRCIIKIDDFQEFYSSSHSTQEQLRKIYYPKEQIASSTWPNCQNIPSLNINGLNSDYVQYLNAATEPLPIVPTTIQFNLLTCSNSNNSTIPNTRAENSSNSARPRNDLVEPVNTDNTGRTSPGTRGRSFASRRGSRPFPKKLGQNLSTLSNETEAVRRRSSSDVEVLPDTSTSRTSSADDKDTTTETHESSATEEQSSGTTKSSPIAAPPPKKKVKKYLSPFERPKRRRNRKKPSEVQKPVKKTPRKIQSSSDEDTASSANEVTSIPEKDLEKHFIIIKVPDVGAIYTCKKCETILMSTKAACSHTKCLNRAESLSEDEEDENSSASESSDAEPSDTSKSDTAEPIYHCSYCDRPFARNVVRLQHEQTHLREMNSDDEDVYIEPKRPKISKRKDYDASLVKGFFR